MTFDKGKLIAVWIGLFGAVAAAAAGVLVSSENAQLGQTIAFGGLGLCLLAVVLGVLFLRCPACGKVLLRVMRPWRSGCVCPFCQTPIRFI